MRINGWIVLVVSCLILSGASAQQQQEPTQPGTTKQEGRKQSQDRSKDRQEISLFLTGAVIYEDGNPLTEPVPVELVCGGRVSQQVILGVKGQFTLTVGNKSQAHGFMDASVSGGLKSDGRVSSPWGGVFGSEDKLASTRMGRVDLGGCEVRLSPRAGYVASTILLTSRGILEDPDIGAIVVRRISDDTGTSTTVYLKELTTPKDALGAFENAKQELSRKDVNYSNAEK